MAEISVIIPVYKVEQYLDKCVGSVLSQTFRDLEIILVDDGSPDSCPQKCVEWVKKDKRVKVIHKPNGGLSSARNLGIKQATGKYIGFVDSDDWIMPQMYERLYEMIKSGDYDIASVGFARTDKEDFIPVKKSRNIKEYTTKEFVKQLLKVGTQESNQYAWNKLYCKNIISDQMYPEGLTDEDVEGTLRAVISSGRNIICSDEPLYIYRINDNSITARIYNSTKTDYLKICDHVVDILNTTEDEDMIYWAKMFRHRADFGVLSRIMVMNIDEKYTGEVEDLENKLLKSLKKNYLKLIVFKWPFSRKLVMTLFCVDYRMTKKVYKRLNNI